MKVQIYGKNITVTPAIAEKIEKKLNHLEKYFIIDENVVANVVVRVYPNKQKSRLQSLQNLQSYVQRLYRMICMQPSIWRLIN